MSQGQRKAKTLGFIFLHIFPLIMFEFGVALKQFKLSILILLLSEIFETWEVTAVLQTAEKTPFALVCIWTFKNRSGSSLAW